MRGIISKASFPEPDARWRWAPDERSPAFLPTFAGISVALQTALRERVPAAYFENVERYGDIKRAYPMLVYQASRPFRGKIRAELTYDVLNPGTLASLFRTAKPNLMELLAGVEGRLRTEGLHRLASQYERRRVAEVLGSVQRLSRSRKCLNVLVRAESVLMNALVELAGLGSLAPRNQAVKLASFAKKWNFQLRRLYPGMDFTCLAPALLEAATEALGRDWGLGLRDWPKGLLRAPPSP